MASENVLVLLSVVFKKFGLIANEFLSVICQFLNFGIINLSLEFYIFTLAIKLSMALVIASALFAVHFT